MQPSPHQQQQLQKQQFQHLQMLQHQQRLQQLQQQQLHIQHQRQHQVQQQQHNGHGVQYASSSGNNIDAILSRAPALDQQQALAEADRTAKQFLEQRQHEREILSSKKIQDLVAAVDPSEKLDPDVEKTLQRLADDFIEGSVAVACQLARHRKSTSLEVRDVQLHLEKQWGIRVPGFTAPVNSLPAPVRRNEPSQYRKRLALVKKSMGSRASGLHATSTNCNSQSLPPAAASSSP